MPLWDGRPADGNLLLWAEQGIGDEIFYSSLLSLLDPERQKISLSADKRLHSIYARSFPKFQLFDRTLVRANVSGQFGAHAPIGNLGHLLGIDEDRMKERKYPYLVSDRHRTSQLRQSLFPGREKPVCGIAWKSGNKKLGRSRSIDLVNLAPLWAHPDMEFVNLQYGDVASEIALVAQRFGRRIEIAPHIDVFNDMEGLLALIDMCDIVFTIDNLTAHLAGAFGKKGVVLVPRGEGRYWYWGEDSYSHWYPSLRTVFQDRVGDWSTAIEEAALLAGQIAAGA